MAITKVFRSGNSQAVRIPKRFRFRSQHVEILTGLARDFFKGGRRQPKLDKRLGL
jgi:hypothetical protein